MQRSHPPFLNRLSHLPAWQLAGGSLLGLLTIGGIDYLVTVDLGLSIFYVLPIATLTWYRTPKLGYLASGLSALLWFQAEMARTQTTTPLGFILWNTLVRLAFFVIVVHLLAELKAAYRQEQYLAQTDFLTTLLNRRAFNHILTQEIQRSQRHSLTFTLTYLDIDNFKQVNDQLGHAAGDRLLQEIAAVLAQQLRVVDFQARLGGDEFAILMTQTDQSQATAVLKRLFGQLTKSLEHAPKIGFSIGAMTFTSPLPQSADEALSAADKLMYAVKSQGKNRILQGIYQGPSTPPHCEEGFPQG